MSLVLPDDDLEGPQYVDNDDDDDDKCQPGASAFSWTHYCLTRENTENTKKMKS